jgi:cytochrome c peroxidase
MQSVSFPPKMKFLDETLTVKHILYATSTCMHAYYTLQVAASIIELLVLSFSVGIEKKKVYLAHALYNMPGLSYSRVLSCGGTNPSPVSC